MNSYRYDDMVAARCARAQAIAAAGSLGSALAAGSVPTTVDLTLSECLVLGLLRQGVTRYVGIFGHGSTEIGEVLRVYAAAGLVRTFNVRHEVEASHAAAALRWVTGEKAAVITSIGPGALHAVAGALTPASNGIGVWYLLGDKTTEDEGPNMQQLPGPGQQQFLRLCESMGSSYCLHTPEAVATALRRGLNTVDHAYRAGPFFLTLPMNVQSRLLPAFNLNELPVTPPPLAGAAADDGACAAAAAAIVGSDRTLVKVGGGSRDATAELVEFLELADAVAVLSPLLSGALPYAHPRNLTVGGSKGSLCGNFAMDEADLLVALGTRAVCQSDCSRTGYPHVRQVVSINADPEAATHYQRSLALVGDVRATLSRLNVELRRCRGRGSGRDSAWFTSCRARKKEWIRFKAERYEAPCLYDPAWQRQVLTQPAAIKAASDWARGRGAVCFFDAGDVQANGFQIVEDDRLGRSFSDTGASYMGFAASALLATAMASTPFYAVAFSGDGSFVMNPQILIDGVLHGARGCILLLDNRRMGAITGLQLAQYGAEYATADQVAVDYVAWAQAVPGVAAYFGGHSVEELCAALYRAHESGGLALIHVPVYFGPDDLGGMGVFGRWNVGNWCDEVQQLRHRIGL